MDVVPIPATLEALSVKALAEPIAVPMHVGALATLPLVPPPPPPPSSSRKSDAAPPVLSGESALRDGEAKRAKTQDDNELPHKAMGGGNKKDSNPETKGKRTLYMRAEWPGLIFYRDCTFASTARKLEAKAIWETVKRRTEAPKSEEEVTCALLATCAQN